MKILKLIILFIFILFPALINSEILAKQTSLGIYPPIIQIKALSGATVQAPIQLINESNEQLEISIHLRGFDVPDVKSEVPLYYPEKDTPKKLLSFLNNVTISDEGKIIKSINLYPKESKKLTLSFPVGDRSEEEFYFSVIFSSKPELPHQKSTNIAISPAVAVLVFVSLNEKENLMPTIEKFSTAKFHTSSPIRFNLTVLNTGNSFKNVSGSITVYNMFGGTAGKITIPPHIIPANTSRDLGTNYNGQIDWDEKFIYGFYTAKAVLSYDNAPTVAKEISFFIIPVLPFSITIIALFVLFGVMFRVVRKLNLKER